LNFLTKLLRGDVQILNVSLFLVEQGNGEESQQRESDGGGVVGLASLVGLEGGGWFADSTFEVSGGKSAAVLGGGGFLDTSNSGGVGDPSTLALGAGCCGGVVFTVGHSGGDGGTGGQSGVCDESGLAHCAYPGSGGVVGSSTVGNNLGGLGVGTEVSGVAINIT